MTLTEFREQNYERTKRALDETYARLYSWRRSVHSMAHSTDPQLHVDQRKALRTLALAIMQLSIDMLESLDGANSTDLNAEEALRLVREARNMEIT